MPYQPHDPRALEEQFTSKGNTLKEQNEILTIEIARIEGLKAQAKSAQEWQMFQRQIEALERMREVNLLIIGRQQHGEDRRARP